MSIKNNLPKVVLPIILLLCHIKSYGIVAYIPQSLRECITAVYEKVGSKNSKQALAELYAAIRENRMLTSDAVVSQGVQEALEIVRSSNSSDHQRMAEYFEQYLDHLDDRGILLNMEGDASQLRSWPLGLVDRCMREEREAYDLFRLSNELSDNLTFCGGDVDNQKCSRGIVGVSFSPNVMTSSQSTTPNVILGGTGVGAAVINGWSLVPDGPQFPINMQFIVPKDFKRHEPVSLELGILVPNNDLPNGYVNIQVQSKYLESSHSFNADAINWTHTNSSGNIKVDEASNPDNVKYMYIKIPLTKTYIKKHYFALLSVSRILPTDGKTEYAGDLTVVSAIFKYRSTNE